MFVLFSRRHRGQSINSFSAALVGLGGVWYSVLQHAIGVLSMCLVTTVFSTNVALTKKATFLTHRFLWFSSHILTYRQRNLGQKICTIVTILIALVLAAAFAVAVWKFWPAAASEEAKVMIEYSYECIMILRGVYSGGSTAFISNMKRHWHTDKHAHTHREGKRDRDKI